MSEQELRQQFEEYKKWRNGFNFNGNENLFMYLFCLRKMEMIRASNSSCYEWNVKIVDEKIKEVLSNSSPPVRTSNSMSLTSEEPKGFNKDYQETSEEVSQIPNGTSLNPNIKQTLK